MLDEALTSAQDGRLLKTFMLIWETVHRDRLSIGLTMMAVIGVVIVRNVLPTVGLLTVNGTPLSNNPITEATIIRSLLVGLRLLARSGQNGKV